MAKHTYILVDTANMFFRARHVVRGDDIDTKIGMAYHIMFASILKAYRDFNGSHVVFCLEGRSWRKDYYAPYKRNRSDARAAHTEKQAEEEKVFWEAFDTFKDFIAEKTNCTVLQNPQLEADDLIAGWIQTHPNDDHVIISTDSDFVQLIAPNVRQYNGVMETTITHEGILDKKGKRVIDKKTNAAKDVPNPEWLLFEKCMRGDPTDNVFSAYPKVRNNKLEEAFNDRNNRGFAWNNMMLQRWVDHENVEHRVRDRYLHNRMLIDLTQQPDDVKVALDESIKEQTDKQRVSQVGLHFVKFCSKWNLPAVADKMTEHGEYLGATYK